jgi:hypothetical protein
MMMMMMWFWWRIKLWIQEVSFELSSDGRLVQHVLCAAASFFRLFAALNSQTTFLQAQ